MLRFLWPPRRSLRCRISFPITNNRLQRRGALHVCSLPLPPGSHPRFLFPSPSIKPNRQVRCRSALLPHAVVSECHVPPPGCSCCCCCCCHCCWSGPWLPLMCTHSFLLSICISHNNLAVLFPSPYLALSLLAPLSCLFFHAGSAAIWTSPAKLQSQMDIVFPSCYPWLRSE